MEISRQTDFSNKVFGGLLGRSRIQKLKLNSVFGNQIHCLSKISLHDRRFMSQARRTRYFARSATQARSARRGEEKNQADGRSSIGGTARRMDCEQALYFSLPLVSRFALVSRSTRNIALASLGSYGACHAG